ncbi:MAG: 3-dehydroquinate synthase [Eubacteriales bacterium]|nr:3-dehydroquinate synthase [Eubacteriales bacterium]
MTLHVNLGEKSYDIVIERGSLKKAGEYLDLQRKVLIVTDSGVPEAYAELLAAACREPVICRIPQGEENKNLAVYETLLRAMLEHHFSRKDCVAAVGGGICGDMAGFAASCYMRGIDFYNIPTTVLSQVDSSVGGKTAVNLGEIKNVVGTFYQPKRVLIDVDVLKTLPVRHVSAGLAEALKMSVTFDEELFRIFEDGDPLHDPDHIETIIEKALRIKIAVVEQDEKEQGLRKALNFGHTIGHGIESLCLDGSLYHGECVAIGMLPMCADGIRQRLLPVLEKLHLPTSCRLDPERVLDAMMHDKKASEGQITIIETDRIGAFTMRRADREALKPKVRMVTI